MTGTEKTQGIQKTEIVTSIPFKDDFQIRQIPEIEKTKKLV